MTKNLKDAMKEYPESVRRLQHEDGHYELRLARETNDIVLMWNFDADRWEHVNRRNGTCFTIRPVFRKALDERWDGVQA